MTGQPQSDAAAVSRGPGWFPEHFDARVGELSFVLTDRETLAGQPFLDARWDRTGAERKRVPAVALADKLPAGTPHANVLWHTGFCCSTLLAKALDAPARNLSLCEPQILVELADMKRDGNPSFAGLAPLVFRLLARGFVPGAAVTLKPSPAANFLLPEAVHGTAGQMLFLYSDCASFLISLFKLGKDGAAYARSMLKVMIRDGMAPADWPVPQLMALGPLEAGAFVWHMQMAQFRRHWAQLGGRAHSLDCDVLLDSPVNVLTRLDDVFGLKLGRAHNEQAVQGPLFGRNAKQPHAALNAAKRREQHAKARKQLGAELDRIVSRGYELYPTTPRGSPLPNPLLTTAKTYFP